MKEQMTVEEYLVPIEICMYMPLGCESCARSEMWDAVIVTTDAEVGAPCQLPCWEVNGLYEPVAYVLLSHPMRKPVFLEDPCKEAKNLYRMKSPMSMSCSAMVLDTDGRWVEMRLRPVLVRWETFHEPAESFSIAAVLPEGSVLTRGERWCGERAKPWRSEDVFIPPGHHSTCLTLEESLP